MDATYNSTALNKSSGLNFEQTPRLWTCMNPGMGRGKPKEAKPELVPIGRRLIDTREALGFVGWGRQKDFALEVGLKPNRYNQWERAHIRPTPGGLSKIRRRFGVTYEWIWDGDPKGLPFELATKLKLAQPATPAAGETVA